MSHQNRYFASIIGGLEDIVAQELKWRVPEAAVVGQICSQLIIDCPRGPEVLMTMRSIENLYACIGHFDGLDWGRKGLAQIEEFVLSADLSEAVEAYNNVNGEVAAPVFRGSATRQGQHAYTSTEIAAALGGAIGDMFDWAVSMKKFDYEFVAKVCDDACLIGLRISHTALHKRYERHQGLAPLNPTLAYAMGVFSQPEPGQLVLDPMCGTGTTLLERAAIGPAVLFGSDFYARPLTEARSNAALTGTDIRFCRADARALPYQSESMDRVITNPPWGRRVLGHQKSLRPLYHQFLPEIARVLKPGGLAVVLTLQRRLTEAVLAQNHALELIHDRVVRISGMKPHLYVVRKRD